MENIDPDSESRLHDCGLPVESVWDYPRPPALQSVTQRIRVIVDGHPLADTQSALRILETSHPPVYYIPPSDIDRTRLSIEEHTSFCEWKGRARYWRYETETRKIASVAWSYPSITNHFQAIAGYLAFYPSKVDECWVDDLRAEPQEGDFYGGWITPNLVGPIKGGPGTRGW